MKLIVVSYYGAFTGGRCIESQGLNVIGHKRDQGKTVVYDAYLNGNRGELLVSQSAMVEGPITIEAEFI